MKLALILMMNLSFALSAVTIENKTFDSIEQSETCLDEYVKREKQLKKWLIWNIPGTVVATPVGGAAGMVLGSAVAKVAGVQGWSLLGAALGSGMIFGASALAGGIIVEGITYDKFRENRLFIRSIIEVNSESSELLSTKKLLKKINKKLEDDVSLEVFIDEIKYLDASNKLCDGSLRLKVKKNKLKFKLARKKDLIRFFK